MLNLCTIWGLIGKSQPAEDLNRDHLAREKIGRAAKIPQYLLDCERFGKLFANERSPWQTLTRLFKWRLPPRMAGGQGTAGRAVEV